MRTLAKLKHEQFQDARSEASVQDAERKIVKNQEWTIWRKRARWAAIVMVTVLVVYGAARFLFAWGRTADGIVVAPSVEVVAPSGARVVEVYCEPGQRLAVGDPLLRWEPIADPQRLVLHAEVAEAEARLRLVRAGGSLGDTQPERRWDRLSEAELELARGETAWQQARVKARGLERARDGADVVLRQDRVRLAGAAAVLTEQIAGATAELQQAQARARDAELRAEARGQLGPRGVLSEVEVSDAVAARDIARAEVAAKHAAVEGLRRAHDAATRDHGLDAERAGAALDELDATVAAAWLQADRSKAEVLLLRQRVQERRAVLPTGAVTAQELQEMEVALAEADLESRRARLAAHDEGAGRGVVRAQSAGVVDQVRCRAGDLVDAGTVVVSYFDPAAQWVEVFVDPDLAASLDVELSLDPLGGVPCSMVPEAAGAACEGFALGVGRAWQKRPEVLGEDTAVRPALYRSVRVNPADPEALAPRMRVAVVFR